MLALFGELQFDTLTSPESIYVVREYAYAEHKVVEARPRLQWLAQELQKISLDLSFHIAFANPLLQMRALRAAAEDHQARALIFGNGIHLGYFVIEALEETHQQLADDGSYIAISARIGLREWVSGADFDPFAPPRRTTPPPGILRATSNLRTSQTFLLGSAVAPPSAVFSPNQPATANNTVPASTIVQLGSAGVAWGVTYSAAAYEQLGVSGVVAKGPGGVPPGNYSNVPTSSIVRAG